MPLSAHGVTHTGRRRTNEDAMLVVPALGLFVVADGMGGHNAGEVASAIAVKAIHEFVAARPAPSEATLREALGLANDEVLSAGATNLEYAGMGTTVVAAQVTEAAVVFGSVGDSRIYHWRAGSLTQLTRDDSWVERVLPGAGLSPEDAQRHPMRHVLTKVVGLREDMEPALGVHPFLPGDVLLLSSDGLHGTATDEQIAAALGADVGVEAIAQGLVDQALTGGATDNVTVVVVRRE